LLFAGTVTDFEFEDGASAYLVPAAGTVAVNGIRVEARDGLAVHDERAIRIEALADAELVLVVTAPAPGR
jgi:quercetin 2,3-dioxygenase